MLWWWRDHLSKTSHEHVRHMQADFERLWQWRLRLHHNKYKFFHDRLAYLGHMSIPWGSGLQQSKVDTLQKIPKCAETLCLANYYRRFVKGFSLIAKPLTILTSKYLPWTWGCQQYQIFETLKQRLDVAPILRHLNFLNLFNCIWIGVHWV